MSGYIGNIPMPQATQTRETFTATASQTSFATSGYTPGFVDVWQNGVKLVNGDDFTANNGSDVVLTVGAASGDTVEVLSFSTFEVNSQTFTGTTTLTGDLQATTATFSGAVTGTSATLSGGVYVGGTGAANYLDDYEEGTWSPYWSDTNGNAIFNAAPADSSARYTKVGDSVHATCYFAMPASFGVTGSYSGSGILCVGGLPFTSNRSGSLDYAGVSVGWYNSFGGWGAGYSPMMYVESGTTVMPLVYAGGTVITIVQQVVAYNAGSGLIFSVSYKTAS